MRAIRLSLLSIFMLVSVYAGLATADVGASGTVVHISPAPKAKVVENTKTAAAVTKATTQPVVRPTPVVGPSPAKRAVRRH